MRFRSMTLAAMAISASLVWGDELPPAQPEVKPAAAAAKKQLAKPKITIGKDTTFVVGPLRADGTVDFLAAINEHASRGVTPENNAAIPFWQIVGPSEIDEKLRDRFFQKLGIDPLPKEGEYFVGLDNFLKQLEASDSPLADLTDEDPTKAQEKQDRILTQQSDCLEKPWQAKDFPILAAWLAKNDKLLDQLQEATKRDKFYTPYMVETEDTTSMVSMLLPALMGTRELVRALTNRAMLRLSSGQIAAAEDDLLACHRLARHIANGETLVDSLVAIAIDHTAQSGDRGLANSGKLSIEELRGYAAQLRALPPLAPMIERINFGERLTFVDSTIIVSYAGVKGLTDLGLQSQLAPLFNATLKQGVEWDAVLRLGNGWYDRLVTAGREPDYAKQKAALEKVEAELRLLSNEAGDIKSFTLQCLTKGLKAAVTNRTGGILMALLLPATTAALSAEHRSRVENELTQFAFALAIYHAEHQEYPTELAALVPKYLNKIPLDLFSGNPFLYSASKDGYLVYSVGRNGIDEEGIGYGDEGEKTGDDLSVRVGQQ